MPEQLPDPVDGDVVDYDFIDYGVVIFTIEKGGELYKETYYHDVTEKVE